ncbi:MAG: 50S ribosomal protein L18a [Candidatus Bathyarchaeota archaeon]|nr:MAG: 50S ribosomal protein L18a [Candidatus Bathyarchaeota archaeon]
MTEVKLFRVKGEILDPNYHVKFSKDLKATKPKDAIEKIYTVFGGQHKVKRVHIRVNSIEEIKL